MPKIIEAIYENGVFKPLEKVELKEGEKVKLKVSRELKDLMKRFAGIGGYREKIDEDKLSRVEVDLLE
ncbi:MAG: antitoxin family protein [Syntrophales bacterium]|nr:antitoxin family protein [Syntrophales bacterium]MCX7998424.1 antitoxin family protein [Leptospiraceae bacterium]MDW7990486.1 antitoxin family protein [Archaeoglobaceae archaeon]